MIAVTTFPAWAWDVYAKRCLASWIKAWPGSILAYYEGDAPPLGVPGVEFRPLDGVAGRKRFVERNDSRPSSTYLHDARRFCHKVFAQLDALNTHDQFFWLDADVEMLKPIPEDLLQELLDLSFVSFLGRDTYTETGVVGFNAKHPAFEVFRERYSKCYGLYKDIPVFPTLLMLDYWTDCHAFDFARQGGGYNMTPNGRGVDNVLEQSVLGQYMVHHKGNLKLTIKERANAV